MFAMTETTTGGSQPKQKHRRSFKNFNEALSYSSKTLNPRKKGSLIRQPIKIPFDRQN
jgi:hypothetical protein